MFKNLKKKIEQGVQNTPLRSAVAAISKSDEKVSDDIGSPVASSTPLKSPEAISGGTAGGGDGISTPSPIVPEATDGTPTGQLVDIPLQEGPNDTRYQTATEFASVLGDDTPKVPRSRTSSISSVTSDSSFFQNVSFTQHHYSLPSDIESEVEDSSVNLESVSKDDLYLYIKKYERRAVKYKSKFMELMTIYKDLAQEKEKFKTTLTQSQDQAFRRISELKEQIQLDQLAKRDLEENYRLLLDEKEEFVKVLQMQVKLLKEGKDIPPDLQEKMMPKKSATTESAPPGGGKDGEVAGLREKVRRLEGLLNRCKETIKSGKEKNIQLAEEKENLQRQLEDRQRDIDQLKGSSSTSDISKLQSQIEKAKQVIVQLETDRELAIAEVKKQVHEEIEKKDEEAGNLRGQLLQAAEEMKSLKYKNDELQQKIEKLQKSGQDHLEKSRDIIKRLKDEKKELEEKFDILEQNMEEEKSKLVQELSRGKAAAIALIQQETETRIIERVNATVEERDTFWKNQLDEQQKTNKEILDNKVNRETG
ncbi:golgin subfamily A member 4 [Patella vulgata]|uniref:golgin subfamily A member 4 n=1 Tax=Patella vulgata TaxID=6465 RepID=UPI0024A7B394|nr:golgin subfamily A member 4 [Patella vulgata]